MRINRYVAVFIIIFFLSASCAHKSFIKENLETFHEFKLKNGIPVVVKISRHSRIKSLVLSINGGKGLVPPEKAGLDKLALKLMTMESEKYSDVARRTLLKKTSASIDAADGLDFSQYCLLTIDTYFDETFDLYSDLFLHPVFPEKLFNEIVINLKNQYLSDLADGYARVSLVLNTDFFSGHPYSSYLFNTATIDNITLDEVREFYHKNYVASRMAFFAVGDFDIQSLKEKLDSSFGSIAQGTTSDAADAHFTGSMDEHIILDPYGDLKKETAYIRANFEVIPMTHKDYWALVLASDILSDIMTHLIRTKNSMVYSVWSNIFGKKSNYASISAYRTNNPLKVADLISESIDIAASGKCVSPYKSEVPANDFVPVSEGLEFYKTSFETSYYIGLQTNMSIAMKMSESFMLTGDYTSYLKVMDKIKNVDFIVFDKFINVLNSI